jgi:DNA/RNA endonuclease YhcR with UshA esterase domain
MRKGLGSRVLLIAFLVLTLVLIAGCGGGATPQPPTPDVPPGPEKPSPQAPPERVIPWQDARNHIGEYVVVEGPVVSAKYASGSKGQPTFLNIGRPYPDPGRFTALIWGSERNSFVAKYPPGPETYFLNKKVRVRGLIEEYKGIPEIVLHYPDDIWVVP